MRKRVPLGVLAVVEMHHQRDPAVGFFLDLKWQDHMGHKAVKNPQLADLVRNFLALPVRPGRATVGFVKGIQRIGRVTFSPNIKIAAPMAEMLRRSLDGNNARISPGVFIEDALWIKQQAFGVGVDVVQRPAFNLQIEAGDQEIFLVPRHQWQRVRWQTRVLQNHGANCFDDSLDFCKLFVQVFIVFFSMPVVAFIQAIRF